MSRDFFLLTVLFFFLAQAETFEERVNRNLGRMNSLIERRALRVGARIVTKLAAAPDLDGRAIRLVSRVTGRIGFFRVLFDASRHLQQRKFCFSFLSCRRAVLALVSSANRGGENRKFLRELRIEIGKLSAMDREKLTERLESVLLELRQRAEFSSFDRSALHDLSLLDQLYSLMQFALIQSSSIVLRAHSPFQAPWAAGIAIAFGSVIGLCCTALIVTGLFWARVTSEGNGYLWVAAGLGCMGIMRMVWGAIGLVGAGPQFNIPRIVPLILDRLISAMVAGVTLLFLFLWMEAYHETFSPRPLLTKTSLFVISAFGFILPLLAVAEVLLIELESSPITGHFPEISAPISYGIIVLCCAALVFYANLLRRRIATLNAARKDRYIHSTQRMLLISAFMCITSLAACGVLIYLSCNKMGLIMGGRIEMFRAIARLFGEVPFFIGFLAILSILLLGAKLSQLREEENQSAHCPLLSHRN